MKTIKKIFLYCTYFSVICLLWTCNSSIKSNNLSEKPNFTEGDEQFADVFKLLDGTWKGEFTILEDPNPKNVDEVNLEDLTIEQVQLPHLKTVNTIKVKQVYTSESPYFQRVIITDFYPESNKEEISHGVNKIENGKMWCIVNKAHETVIHHGKTDGKQTIIWQQNQESPQKIEFFQETVNEKFYGLSSLKICFS